ncbi:hypothetical protein RhiirC2_848765 [Rhizophagus irregularis]|uniref:Protein kinase domain-containing protein n=1 Tax=Rhizophagus irregularis TaxID=588596 RepID=A0A2N1NDI5_9GLOM|nr:hypothetical protein RhiirC2_848765 [Rhizophagus irregularis]
MSNKTIVPYLIPEWIPYNNLQNIKYLAKGGFSEIYTAGWIDGHFIEWDSERQQLKRFGNQIVILKRLKNVENARQSWIEEAKSHLNISNKYEEQEAFHSNKSYNFYIPNNIEDFNKSSSKKNITSKISTIFKGSSKKLSNIFKRSSKNDDYKVESMRKRIKKLHINDNDEDEAHNNPNLHSEEQDELELPENTE